MKKLLSLLMCLALMSSVLASCNNDESPPSSEASEMSEASQMSEITETSESSEITEESQEEIQIPEKVVYFTGEYVEYVVTGGKFISGNRYFIEKLSSDGGITDLLAQNAYSDDTYFHIGAFYWSKDFESFTTHKNERLVYLKDYGFIFDNNHTLLYDKDYWGERFEAKTTEEELAVFDKYFKEKFPELNINVYDSMGINNLFSFGFYAVGYISVADLKQLAKETDEKSNLYFILLPAPDDQKRWLTYHVSY